MRESAPARRVHVAVDAHNLAGDERGIGRYARAVLVRMLRDPSFRFTFVVRRMFPRAAPVSRALDGAAVDVTNRVPRDADVVWSPWNGTFLESAAPSVATVHDAGPFVYPARSPRLRAREQGPFLKTAATARRILVQSQFTAREVERWLGVDAAKIVVTPLAADGLVFRPGPARALPSGLLAGEYLLYVGTHEERKNTAPFIEAYARAFPNGEPKLAFTRPPAALPRGGIVLEPCDDASLAALYRGAEFVVAPSPYEGFGLPALEAMACGAPVLAARGGGLGEIGGTAVGWVDEPFAVAAWCDALRALVADAGARARLAELGPPQASTFSWDRCAMQTLAVLREVAEAAN
jgi:alpha-1,3-rhamnosyl/mannosyltransferase